MKGQYGYFATILTFITGFAALLYLTERDTTINDSLGVYMILLVVLAGFIGGFIAPYHLKKTVFRSVGTIIVLAIIFLIFLNFILQQGPISDDPTAGLGLTLVIFVLIIGTIFVSVAGIVLISGGGVFGALIGRQVFVKEDFEDLELLEEYVEYY